MRYLIVGLAVIAVCTAAVAAPEGGTGAAAPETTGPLALDAGAFVYVDGKVQDLIPRPRVVDGQLFVPLRPVAEALGITSHWLPDRGVVQLTHGQRTLTLRRSQLVVTSEATLVALRRLTDLCGADLEWDPERRVALVTTPPARLRTEPVTAPAYEAPPTPAQTAPTEVTPREVTPPQTAPTEVTPTEVAPAAPTVPPSTAPAAPGVDTAEPPAAPAAIRLSPDAAEIIAKDPGGYHGVAAAPDGGNLAMAVRSGDGEAVWFNGRIGPRYDRIRSLAVAPGGRNMAYIAQQGETFFVVRDGRLGPAYQEVLPWSLQYSPGGTRLAYFAERNLMFFSVVNGVEGRPYEMIVSKTVQFSPNGKRYAYAARRAGKWFVVVDGREGPAYDGVSLPVFSANSAHLGYRARRGDVVFAVVDGSEHRPYLDMHSLTFSPDSEHVAYAARVGDAWSVIRDGNASARYQFVGEGSLSYSPDSSHLAFAAKSDDRWHPVVDGQVGPGYAAIDAPVLCMDNGRTAYVAREAAGATVVVGGARGSSYVDITDLQLAPGGSRVAYCAAVAVPPAQPRQRVVIDGRPGPAYDWVRPPVFSADGAHVAYLAMRDIQVVLVLDGEERLALDWAPQEAPAFDEAGTLRYTASADGKIQRFALETE